jgi:hypothetical protein
MKARMFVVDEKTIEKVRSKMEVSAIVPEPVDKSGKIRMGWLNTVIDIASDLMQVEIGDYIFLWETGTQKIYGVYRAISQPFYSKECGDNDIFKIKIDKVYDFKNPINEYDIINNPHMKNKLWNLIGKKVAGKSRATTPITFEEMQFLIQALIGINNRAFSYYPGYEKKEVDNKLSFNLADEIEKDIPSSLDDYQYEPFKIKKKSEVYYEKALEGILNIWIRDKEKEKLAALDIDIKNIIWYANNLPYGIEQSQMDYMIMESVDGSNINKIDVLELKKDIIDYDHINRCLRYAKWVKETIANENEIVRPILVCGEKSYTSKNGFKNRMIEDAINQLPSRYGFEGVDIYTYQVENNTINFKKFQGE